MVKTNGRGRLVIVDLGTQRHGKQIITALSSSEICAASSKTDRTALLSCLRRSTNLLRREPAVSHRIIKKIAAKAESRRCLQS
jgi:hypothetical protein